MPTIKNKLSDRIKVDTTSRKDVSLLPGGTNQPIKNKNIRPVIPEKIIKKKKE